MPYQCPLCGQPVTRSHYNKITGIWKEREKLLAKIREEREKVRRQAKTFTKQRTQLIRQAVQKQVKPLQSKITALRQTQRQLEADAQKELRRAKLDSTQLQREIREKLLRRIDEQRSQFAQRIRHEQQRLQKESQNLKKENALVIRRITEKQQEKLRARLTSLELRERQTKKRAEERLQRLASSAQIKAEKDAAMRLNRLKRELRSAARSQVQRERTLGQRQLRGVQERYKQLDLSYRRTLASAQAKEQNLKSQVQRFSELRKQLRVSMRKQLKRERERGAQQVQNRYRRLNDTFRSTLTQMKAKTSQIREQTRQIRELERQLKRQTTPQIEGLLSESTLLKELKKRFPLDKFEHPGKAGDILHQITRNGQSAGLIVYECKRVKHYSANHVTQALVAKEKRRADFAVLVTNSMKKGTQGFFTERGVVIVHPAGLLLFVSILRSQMVRITEMKLGQRERDKAIKMTLDYLEGPQFSNSMDAIVEESVQLYRDLLDEVQKHIATWKRRYSAYNKVHEEALSVKDISKALLSGQSEYKQLIQTDALHLPALPDMPEIGNLANDENSSGHKPGTVTAKTTVS